MAGENGTRLAAMARALYIGIVTDTGKFMYDATDARTHRVAADLIEAGVDVDDVNRRLYESMPIEKLRLLSRALDNLELHCDGQLIVSYITDDDYRETGAGEEMTEGIIDNLRAVDGIRVAAVIRDQVSRGHSARKISLRAGDDHTDVSVLARKFGGGGHVRAAGAIKSGGTTRRAAKMVVVDADHPDIESYIDWKVREEQKVAALVTGSRLMKRHLNEVIKACHAGSQLGDKAFEPAANAAAVNSVARSPTTSGMRHKPKMTPSTMMGSTDDSSFTCIQSPCIICEVCGTNNCLPLCSTALARSRLSFPNGRRFFHSSSRTL